jgi:hypothetical protein
MSIPLSNFMTQASQYFFNFQRQYVFLAKERQNLVNFIIELSFAERMYASFFLKRQKTP